MGFKGRKIRDSLDTPHGVAPWDTIYGGADHRRWPWSPWGDRAEGIGDSGREGCGLGTSDTSCQRKGLSSTKDSAKETVGL